MLDPEPKKKPTTSPKRPLAKAIAMADDGSLSVISSSVMMHYECLASQCFGVNKYSQTVR